VYTNKRLVNKSANKKEINEYAIY